MTGQAAKLSVFRSLHQTGKPLVLVNIWDPGSARSVAAAGAAAVATGSASVGGALGYSDGETVPLDLVLLHAKRIVQSVEVPVSIDFEAGYAATPDGVAENTGRLIESGAVGMNLEDGYPSDAAGGLRSIEDAADRIRAARALADSRLPGFWINARTDICLETPPEMHADQIAQIMERAKAYADAGGSSLFVPGLRDLSLIKRVCDSSPLPVNIMAGPDAEGFRNLADAGVSRISYGPFPWRAAMASLTSFVAAAEQA